MQLVLNKELRINKQIVPVLVTIEYSVLRQGVRVIAKCLCETGSDSLTNVMIENEKSLLETALDYSMIDNAIDSLRENIYLTFNKIKNSVNSH